MQNQQTEETVNKLATRKRTHTLLQDTIRFIHDQRQQIAIRESLRVLQMIQQSSRRAHDNADAPRQLLGLGATVGAAHDQAVRLMVLSRCHKFLQDPVNLHGEFAGWRNHYDARAVARAEFGLVE